jgi:hypothetical protein
MTSSASSHPALALKLKRGGKQGTHTEILDSNSGRPVALILEGEHAETLAQLVLASPDLLYGVLRAAAHLGFEDPAAAATPEQRKIFKLLRDVFSQATKHSAPK